jgi:hypothetical protein
MFFDFRPDRAFRLPVIKMPVILAGLADAPGPTHAATPMSNNVKVAHHELLPECVCAYAPADLAPGKFWLVSGGLSVHSASPKSGAILPRYSESCE